MSYSFAGQCLGELQVYGFGIVLILGSFALNAGSAPATTSVKGKGISTTVAYSSGTYTLTFTNSALAVLSCWAQLQCVGTAVDLYAQFGAIDVVTALTAIIQLKFGATNTQPPAADANSRCHFGFFMATSSLTT